MKTSILVAAMVACAVSVPIVYAQEKSAPAKPAMGMHAGMNKDKQMPEMQENMKKMQQQMDKIRTTTDPAERRKLMQAHMQAMQENMKAMRGMGGHTMMGGGEHGGMMKGGDMKPRQETMENRMDMMQMMMEQMMQRDQMMQSIPAN